MKYSPVIVFAYKRLDHFSKTLDALNKSPLASYTDLYIMCDGYKSEKDMKDVVSVHDYAKSFSKNNNFKKTVLNISQNNKGLASSIINGVSSIIREYGSVIVLEDDLITSPDFLSYMNSGLSFFEEDKDKWAICGYTFPMKSLSKANKEDVYMMQRSSSWGWATWKDRWESIDWEVKTYKSFKHNWLKRFKFGRWGGDLPIMLDYQMNKLIDSWAIRWCYSQHLQHKWAVFPKNSLVKNIGFDGSGTHSGTASGFDVNLSELKQTSFDFANIYYSREIRRDCAKKFNGKFTSYCRNHLKAFLRRIGIISY